MENKQLQLNELGSLLSLRQKKRGEACRSVAMGSCWHLKKLEGEDRQQLKKCRAVGCPVIIDGEDRQHLKCPAVGCLVIMEGEDQ